MARQSKPSAPKPTVVLNDRAQLRDNNGAILTANRNRDTKETSITIALEEDGQTAYRVTVSDATLLAFAAVLVKLTKKKGA